MVANNNGDVENIQESAKEPVYKNKSATYISSQAKNYEEFVRNWKEQYRFSGWINWQCRKGGWEPREFNYTLTAPDRDGKPRLHIHVIFGKIIYVDSEWLKSYWQEADQNTEDAQQDEETEVQEPVS